MKYYIDFDNTIFNTVSFYNDLEKIMIEYGINKDHILEYKDRHTIYDPLELIDIALNKERKKQTYLAITNLFQKNNYLYADAISFLQKLKEHGDISILFTYGSYRYQDFKIKASGILQYFDDIIITSTPKYLEDIPYSNSIFIDDNPFVIKQFAIRGAQKIIRIKRDNNAYSQIPLDNLPILEYNDMNQISLE